MTNFVAGLSIGFSLILAIGAQNAFVLRQGLKKQYVFMICLICALSDSILIFLGVTGFAKIIQHYPIIVVIAKYLGAVFLFAYGGKHFYSAIQHNDSLQPSATEHHNIYQMIAMSLAFTWLNPHVYLDTLFLIGAVSVQYQDDSYLFALGAMMASWIFFFSLGFGARLLLPLFRQPRAWQILDLLIGLVMWGIALSLLVKT
ncbi:MAG: LysE/ArgO family amino acid transporter [Acinetobacter populi]|jgi:L-lysine exporter family protein LysE/ArgO|uniref:LysE/ArgO family amino acid transporter n=1 Tax=Acinetobacter populi TaxID=1582270 RepID=UPI002357037E|nr:LysE/ArgO family amino acid transporter [Acinetobacter populi]MCH4246687.1 LysE/ArgO family amino acid transporter [Acinetobacter populi]